LKIEPDNKSFQQGKLACRKLFLKDKSEAEILKMDGNDLFKAGKGE
jgi:hypothetical protein